MSVTENRGLERAHRLIRAVLRHEGGYVNDPRDPGGETKYGISKRSYPNRDIRRLTRAEASEIYVRDWWVRHNYRHIDNDTLAGKILDISVNVGQRRANRWLQQAINQAGGRLRVDGIVGPRTIRSVNAADAAAVLLGFVHRAYRHYVRLAQKMPEFERGWLNRLMDSRL